MSKLSHTLTISNQTARRFLLNHHFLLPPRQLKPDQIVSKLFRRLGSIQFDTINIVGRNADLVLQSRVEDYKPDMLDKLLYTQRTLIDGWDKMASIYQTNDWPHFNCHRERMRVSTQNRSKEASNAAPEILRAIKENGPSSSIDFDDNRKTDWWWAPTSVTRAALESLFAQGEIGIHHRINTRRVFDLIEQLIPQEILKLPDPHKTDLDYHLWHIARRIGSMGLASPRSGEYWYGITRCNLAIERRKVLDKLISKGHILTIKVETIPNQHFYLRTEDFKTIKQLPHEDLREKRAAFIAPLDNLIWNRKLIKDLFSFAYTWEVYKPKAKREYGYYVLPVLYGDSFIARTEMKFDRKTNLLHLIDWWWEDNVQRTPEMEFAIRLAFSDLKSYLGGSKIKMVKENFVVKRQATLFRYLTGDKS